MKTEKFTTYDLVAKIDGRAQYIDSEELFDLPDDTLVADVKVIRDRATGKEAARDQVISDDAWVTAKEYRSKH